MHELKKFYVYAKNRGKYSIAIVKIVSLRKTLLPNPNTNPPSKVNWSAPKNGTLRQVFVPGSYEIEEDFRTEDRVIHTGSFELRS